MTGLESIDKASPEYAAFEEMLETIRQIACEEGLEEAIRKANEEWDKLMAELAVSNVEVITISYPATLVSVCRAKHSRHSKRHRSHMSRFHTACTGH